MYVNSKGFTLIELIAVIALLGIIGIIGISSYTSFYDAIQQKNKNTSIVIIKTNYCIKFYIDFSFCFRYNTFQKEGIP